MDERLIAANIPQQRLQPVQPSNLNMLDHPPGNGEGTLALNGLIMCPDQELFAGVAFGHREDAQRKGVVVAAPGFVVPAVA